jgi:type IV secretory pathway VirB10-like protein
MKSLPAALSVLLLVSGCATATPEEADNAVAEEDAVVSQVEQTTELTDSEEVADPPAPTSEDEEVQTPSEPVAEAEPEPEAPEPTEEEQPEATEEESPEESEEPAEEEEPEEAAPVQPVINDIEFFCRSRNLTVNVHAKVPGTKASEGRYHWGIDSITAFRKNEYNAELDHELKWDGQYDPEKDKWVSAERTISGDQTKDMIRILVEGEDANGNDVSTEVVLDHGTGC